MKLDKKIDILLTQDKALNESGVRNIKLLTQKLKKAKIFFHEDLDGITSALAIKKYLEDYGVKIIDAEQINYGGKEYAVHKTQKGVMNVLVDFAHGKPMMNIHLDHHDGQVGFDKNTQSVKFDKTPSNVQAIQLAISSRDIFPSRDIEIISTIDSADFSRLGLSPDDIIRASFDVDKSKTVAKNHQMMGFTVNKIVLAFKGKKGFLSDLVMNAKPSLISMFNTVVKLAKKNGYKTPQELDKDSETYLNQRISKKMAEGNPRMISTMKSGESFIYGTTIIQKGAGYMGKGNQYDRYTIFKVHPYGDYLLTQWPMGLIQLAKNPFKSGSNKYHLGDLAQKVLSKVKGDLTRIDVPLDYMKYTFERDIKDGDAGAVGFTWADFEALYSNKIKGIANDSRDWWPNMVRDISTMPYSKLSDKQKSVLTKISVTAWDVIQAGSGGHRDITNIQGFAFIRDKTTKNRVINDFTIELAKEMKDKHLE